MKLTNMEMNQYYSCLEEISEKVSGKFAYSVAKNMQSIARELVEYEQIRSDMLTKYGTKGNDGTYSLNIHSQPFKDFIEEMKPYDITTKEVDIVTIEPSIVYSSELNAKEILSIMFMIQEDKKDEPNKNS